MRVNVNTPVSCFHMFFSFFASFNANSHWKMVYEMVNGNIVSDYDEKWYYEKAYDKTCLILSDSS